MLLPRCIVLAGLFVSLVAATACVTQSKEVIDPVTGPSLVSQIPDCAVKGWACTNQYGAISYARGGAWGLAYNHTSQANANNAAQQSCPSSSCSVVATFANSCGAIATAPTGQAGWATGASGDSAQAQALAQCLR